MFNGIYDENMFESESELEPQIAKLDETTKKIEDDESNGSEKELTDKEESVANMLPQIPLTESVKRYSRDLNIEYSSLIDEEITESVKSFGKNLKASVKTKNLIMKINLTKKRIALAKHRKAFIKKIPQMEAELQKYIDELEKVQKGVTDEVLKDMETFNECCINSILPKRSKVIHEDSTPHYIETTNDIMLEGFYNDQGLPESKKESSEKFKGAPLVVSTSRNIASSDLVAFNKIKDNANSVCDKVIEAAMEEIVKDKKIDPESEFSIVYVTVTRAKDSSIILNLYGDINKEISAKISIKFVSSRYKEYSVMVKSNTKNKHIKTESTEDTVVEAANMEDEIKPIVDKLNSLGYKVKYASPGHKKLRKKPDKDKDGVYYSQLYSDARIMFEDDYKFPAAPMYWKWRTVDKRDYLDIKPRTYSPKDGTEIEAWDKWKKEYMKSLTNWVNNLSPKSDSDITRGNDNSNENKERKSEQPDIIRHESVFDDDIDMSMTIESVFEDFSDDLIVKLDKYEIQ